MWRDSDLVESTTRERYEMLSSQLLPPLELISTTYDPTSYPTYQFVLDDLNPNVDHGG